MCVAYKKKANNVSQRKKKYFTNTPTRILQGNWGVVEALYVLQIQKEVGKVLFPEMMKWLLGERTELLSGISRGWMC